MKVSQVLTKLKNCPLGLSLRSRITYHRVTVFEFTVQDERNSYTKPADDAKNDYRSRGFTCICMFTLFPCVKVHIVRGTLSLSRETRPHGTTRGHYEMIRSELIQKLADENPHLYQRDVERIVNTVFEEITNTMARGDRVELRGFGAFSVKKRDARVGRNPRTGESVPVEEKHVPFFKTGKLLRDRLNGK